MNGAEYLCKLLEKNGVDNIFGLFGDIQTYFAHALQKSDIKWIHVHNEKSGGFMADIYSRVSEKTGVVFSTVGPGATNLTSALANATQDRVALVGISDQVLVSELNRETHQYIDLAEAFHKRTGITKGTFIVRKLEELPEIISKAFRIAASEPKGAVHISFPADLYGKEVSGDIKDDVVDSKDVLPESTITHDNILERLNGKKRCLVIAGGSIDRANSQIEFRKFIEKFDLPVLTTFRGKNVLPGSHPNNLGTISRHLGAVLQELIKESSFILAVGYDYNEGLKPSLWGKTEVININSFDNRVSQVFSPQSFFGNLKLFFEKISQEKRPLYKKSFDFIQTKQKIKTIIGKALDIKNKNLHPGRIIDAVNKVFNKETIIVCDVGLNKYYSGLLLESSPSNKILFSNGQSAMAFTSGALGAKIADPKKDVVVLVGDGGFLMDPQEVLTSVEHKESIIWIIFNNGGLGLVEQAQYKSSDKTHGVHFSSVIFTKLAQAFGIDGVHLTKEKNLEKILKQYRKQKKSVIIDVPVEYAVRD